MKYSENALNVLTCKYYKGIGNGFIVKNRLYSDKVSTIVDKLNKHLKLKITEEEFLKHRDNFESKILQKFSIYCDGFVAIGDKDFPSLKYDLKQSEQPVFLYYKGDITLLKTDRPLISVIGLLNPSENIIEREKKIVSALVKKGAVIVSGLAKGCDSIAHLETLDSLGSTIAILPSPLNNILPQSNKNLADRIVQNGGLLITEYGNDFKSKFELNKRYHDRDRLQALFCDLITLVASYSVDSQKKWDLHDMKLDSGARLAMNFAKSYKVRRGVMYDQNIDFENPMFDLNREIIDNNEDIIILDESNYKSKIDNYVINR